jgi:hypothetical protein
VAVRAITTWTTAVFVAGAGVYIMTTTGTIPDRHS